MKLPGKATTALVQTLDLFPTICDLTNVEKPDFAQGKSLVPQLESPDSPGHPTIAYRGGATSIRTNTHRLTVHKGGQVELYDHSTEAKETKNIAAQNPDLVNRLKQKLKSMR